MSAVKVVRYRTKQEHAEETPNWFVPSLRSWPRTTRVACVMSPSVWRTA